MSQSWAVVTRLLTSATRIESKDLMPDMIRNWQIICEPTSSQTDLSAFQMHKDPTLRRRQSHSLAKVLLSYESDHGCSGFTRVAACAFVKQEIIPTSCQHLSVQVAVENDSLVTSRPMRGS